MTHPFVAQLRTMLRARPFRPFTIRMVDGQVFNVPHEDFLFINRSGDVMFDDGVSGHDWINVLLIASIQEKQPWWRIIFGASDPRPGTAT